MTLNVDELQFALRVTEEAAVRGRWDQKHWLTETDCGTGGCLAGCYTLAKGCTPVPECPGFTRTPEGELIMVSWFTAREIGLSDFQASVLFHASNSLQDIRDIVDMLITSAAIYSAIDEPESETERELVDA